MNQTSVTIGAGPRRQVRALRKLFYKVIVCYERTSNSDAVAEPFGNSFANIRGLLKTARAKDRNLDRLLDSVRVAEAYTLIGVEPFLHVFRQKAGRGRHHPF